jgi:peroxin-3
MNTEQITYEIQQIKGAAKSLRSGALDSMAGPPSIADTTMTEEDGKSMATSVSMNSESGIHASQIAAPMSPSTAAAAAGQDVQQSGGLVAPKVSRKTKRQLWDDLKISGKNLVRLYRW